MRHQLVCGVDGSKESRLAARVAAELASVLGRGLVLAHATDDPPTFPYGDARLQELQRRRATHAAGLLLDEVAAGLPAIISETRILFGEPAEALDSLCRDEEAALLVIGSRGRSGLAAALHGSISARLASTGECPVVVVPPGAAERFLSPLPELAVPPTQGLAGLGAHTAASELSHARKRNVAQRAVGSDQGWTSPRRMA